MLRHRLTLLVVIVCSSFLFGCVSTTQIRTNPAGAQVIMDNTIKLGQAPIEHREMVWVWTNRRFEARMPGYQNTVFTIEKEYPWAQNLVVCLCTGLILWPVALASKYVDQTVVELIPAGGASGQPVVESPELAFDTAQ